MSYELGLLPHAYGATTVILVTKQFMLFNDIGIMISLTIRIYEAQWQNN